MSRESNHTNQLIKSITYNSIDSSELYYELFNCVNINNKRHTSATFDMYKYRVEIHRITKAGSTIIKSPNRLDLRHN